MHTCGNFAQCRARSSRPVGPVRRVDVGAGIKKKFRDLNGVLWCLLTKAFDAVGRDVLQQRRLMLARRPGSYQRRPIRPKEPIERRHVSGDDGFDCRLELRQGRVRTRERFNMSCESRPALEPVCPRDQELRVRERSRSWSRVSFGQLLPDESFELTCRALDPRSGPRVYGGRLS